MNAAATVESICAPQWSGVARESVAVPTGPAVVADNYCGQAGGSEHRFLLTGAICAPSGGLL